MLFLFPLSQQAQNVAMDFDGNDDYLDFSTLPLSTSDFTFETWFRSTSNAPRPTCTNGFRPLFALGGNSPSN